MILRRLGAPPTGPLKYRPSDRKEGASKKRLQATGLRLEDWGLRRGGDTLVALKGSAAVPAAEMPARHRRYDMVGWVVTPEGSLHLPVKHHGYQKHHHGKEEKPYY